MARRLDEFPNQRRRSKYPWDRWFDGSTWLLRRGEDFETSAASMRATAFRAAAAGGKQLRTSITKEEDGTEALVIQAIQRGRARDAR